MSDATPLGAARTGYRCDGGRGVHVCDYEMRRAAWQMVHLSAISYRVLGPQRVPHCTARWRDKAKSETVRDAGSYEMCVYQTQRRCSHRRGRSLVLYTHQRRVLGERGLLTRHWAKSTPRRPSKPLI